MAAIDAIRLSTMLVLSALLAVLVVANLFSAAESAAGVAHAVHRATTHHRAVAPTRSGAAWAQSIGRRQAQRQRTWVVVRGEQLRPVRDGTRSANVRN